MAGDEGHRAVSTDHDRCRETRRPSSSHFFTARIERGWWVLLILLVLLLTPGSATAQPQAVGRIKGAAGQTFILRAGDAIPARTGYVVYESDGLRTGPEGRLSLTLRDDTRLSLDPNTELRLDQFVFAPAEGRLGFVMKLVRGAVAYVSGRIAKLSPDAIRLETPNAIVGIRGTRLVIRVGA